MIIKSSISIIIFIYSILGFTVEDFEKAHQQMLEQNKKNIQTLSDIKTDLIGVELIIASGNKATLYKSMGHVFLRFVDSDGIWNNDYGLSFSANIDEDLSAKKSNFIIKGITGGYSTMAEVKSFYDFWLKNIGNDIQSFDRYIIPMSGQSIIKLVDALSIFNERNQDSDYKFFSQNCTSYLTEFLKESGLGHLDKKIIKPKKTKKYLYRAHLTPYPALTVHNSRYVIAKTSKALGLKMEQLYDISLWPEDSFKRLEEVLNEREFKYLYRSLPVFPPSVAKEIVQNYSYYNEEASSYNEVMGVTSVPSELYTSCIEEECLDRKRELAKSLWSEEVITEQKSLNIKYHKRSKTTIFERSEGQSKGRTIIYPDIETKNKQEILFLQSL